MMTKIVDVLGRVAGTRMKSFHLFSRFLQIIGVSVILWCLDATAKGCPDAKTVEASAISDKCLYEEILKIRLVEKIAMDKREERLINEVDEKRQENILDELFFNRNSKASDMYLVKLSSYYFGESGSGIVESAISQRGRRMIPLLLNAKRGGPFCEKRFKRLCLPRDIYQSSADVLIKNIKQQPE